MSTLLAVLKYSGSVVAAFYGVYATLTDFHVRKGGKKILSRKGYLGITLLVLSSILALSADAVKDRKERLEKAAADLQQQKVRDNLDLDLARSQVMSEQLKAALDLLSMDTTQTATSAQDLKKEMGITKSVSSDMGSALFSLKRSLTLFHANHLIAKIGLTFTATDDSLRIWLNRVRAMNARAGSVEWLPDRNNQQEKDVAETLGQIFYTLAFIKDSQQAYQDPKDPKAGWERMDLSYDANVSVLGNHLPTEGFQISRCVMYPDILRMELTIKPRLSMDKGTISSLLDFPIAIAEVSLIVGFSESHITCSLDYLDLMTEDNRRLRIIGFQPVTHVGFRTTFRAKIPKTAKWGSESDRFSWVWPTSGKN